MAGDDLGTKQACQNPSSNRENAGRYLGPVDLQAILLVIAIVQLDENKHTLVHSESNPDAMELGEKISHSGGCELPLRLVAMQPMSDPESAQSECTG